MNCRIIIYVDKENIEQTNNIVLTIKNCQDSYGIVIADDINDQVISGELIDALGDIAGDNVNYIQNDEYLGFGQTVNSVIMTDNTCDWLLVTGGTAVAGSDVEVLSKAVHMSKNNLIAVPRSNKGFLATYPYSDYRFKREHTPEESRDMFTLGNTELPEVTVIPYFASFCVYFKADCYIKSGYLNNTLQNADLCMTEYSQSVKNAGGRIVMCNHDYVENHGVREENIADIPQLNNLALLFERSYQDTSDYFSSLLYSTKKRKLKLLYFMLSVSNVYNGTSEHSLSLLDKLIEKFSDKYEITVLANKDAIEFHHIREKYSNVMETDELSGIFDIGFCPFMFYDIRHQIMISMHCLKIVGWNLDMIMYRCNYLFAKQNFIDSHYKLSDMLVDGYITNSQSVTNDMRDLLGESEFIKNKPIEPILLAVNEQEYDTQEEVPLDKYILVMGNAFKHKAIANTIPYLEKSNHNFIVFGADDTGFITDNIYGYRSGYLTNEFVYYLYSHCDGLLFPSVYEGFGLPIIRALNMGKEVIVNDNFLNQEIISYFTSAAEHIHTYKRFSDIPELVNNLNSGFTKGLIDRNWGDVAEDVNNYFDQLLDSKTDIDTLNSRNNFYSICESTVKSLDMLNDRMDVYNKVQNIISKEINSDKSDSDKLKTVAEIMRMVCGG